MDTLLSLILLVQWTIVCFVAGFLVTLLPTAKSKK
jgi:hypothetical protein